MIHPIVEDTQELTEVTQIIHHLSTLGILTPRYMITVQIPTDATMEITELLKQRGYNIMSWI